ncbi:zinc-ribbon domain-containing protein [Sulfitobacter sp.]|jgi:predicted Zn finger-like uncharacterized protein|uniref:zinc-ribbon domain-containing protein n=1 Tax=Sulfitobacter sp. TaxID=1903071 RepID=UPI000C0C7B35|nr:hypothetical protein [Roseobacter sp.]MBV48924.1 hypothetical protein [Roseobacter sp.]PHR09565.1 MAG: hypothetical protein COB29_03780 [Sulfitobacter sp.]|tara:strand:+ start:96 stop:905 length:810 start_codon:yes stop_codon:yes gene_type:complete
MRLICPNCDAQYEVPDEVIPTSGRDVQCSNCGQTWFQHHPDNVLQEDSDTRTDRAPDENDRPLSRRSPEPTAVPSGERKKLDPSVADILRQEAEAEQEARRRRQAASLESQPDLGLEGADEPRPRERSERAHSKLSRPSAKQERQAPPDDIAATAIGSRRDLLPDIEEINSTLRTGNERRTLPSSHHAKTQPRRAERSAFRSGFLIVVIIATLMVGVYLMAPDLGTAVPQLEPYLTAYVTWIDAARLWLDATLQNVLQWLDAKASQSAG